MAARLTEDGRSRVLLLEAGGDDRPSRDLAHAAENLLIHVPAGVAKVLENRRINWMYQTEPEALDGRVFPYPRGRVLGGTSAINGMIYSRGQHADYDGWRQMGCSGWSWDDVLPYYKRSEGQVRGAADAVRGGDGPLVVTDVPDLLPVSRAAIEARCPGRNPRHRRCQRRAARKGVTALQITTPGRLALLERSGLSSPGHAAAKPARADARAGAQEVVFEGRRAVGVEYEQDGVRQIARANAEVVLCGVARSTRRTCSSFQGSAAANLLSGHGLIEVLVDSPRVGENLQDHFNVSLPYRMKPGAASFNAYQRGFGFLAQAAKFALTRGGAFAGTLGQVVAYTLTRPELVEPDIKILFLPLTMELKESGGRQMIVMAEDPRPHHRRLASCGRSRADSVHIKSADLEDLSRHPHQLPDPFPGPAGLPGRGAAGRKRSPGSRRSRPISTSRCSTCRKTRPTTK